jgi:hypothetical protein
MPLVLLNFPSIQFLGYVVETILNKNDLRIVSYRFENADDILKARQLAVHKALAEKKRFNGLTGSDNRLIGRIRVYVEHIERRPDENPPDKLKRHYILDGKIDNNYQLHLLDYESALYMATSVPAKMIDVEAYGLTFVVIEQCYNELLGFYDDAKLTDKLNGSKKQVIERT